LLYYFLFREKKCIFVYVLAAPVKDIEGDREIMGKVFDLRQ
jgi:hypothetical protein